MIAEFEGLLKSGDLQAKLGADWLHDDFASRTGRDEVLFGPVLDRPCGAVDLFDDDVL